MVRTPTRLGPFELPPLRRLGRRPRARQPGRGHFPQLPCPALPSHRIECTAETVKPARGRGIRWELAARRELACARHLPTLLDRADQDVRFARSPLGGAPPDEVPAPALVELAFVPDRRATAHGRTLLVLGETQAAEPVQFARF
uniref:hypothetical protein n=1 Tax=Amycolatopsis sp. CA-096443 TaxID=3239919 RepID=UPI003F494923